MAIEGAGIIMGEKTDEKRIDFRKDFKEEVDTQQLMGALTKPVAIFVVIIFSVRYKSLWFAGGYIIFILFIKIIFYLLTAKDKYLSGKETLYDQKIKTNTTNRQIYIEEMIQPITIFKVFLVAIVFGSLWVFGAYLLIVVFTRIIFHKT